VAEKMHGTQAVRSASWQVATVVGILTVLSACATATEPVGAAAATPAPFDAPTRAASSAPIAQATPAPRRRTSGNLIVVPDSIDATGSRDVTAELRTLINNAPDDSTIRFKAGGTYRIDSVLFITDKRNVTIDGNGARLDLPREDKGWQSIGFQVRTSTGTTIRDLTMVGNNDRGGTSNTDWSRENNHAILVLSSDDTLIENVDIRRVWGDCLNIKWMPGREGDWSQGLTMRNSSCRLNGRSGVIIHGGTDVVIENNVFDEIGYAVFGFEPDASHEGARDIVFRDNTIGTYSLTSDYRGNVLYACDALWTDGDSTIRNVTLAGNTIEGNRNGKAGEMVGINVKICGDRGIRENFIVTDNTAAKPVVGPVMTFTDVKGVTVSGNDQPLDSGTLATFPGSTGVNSDA
jgi:hypothetical protein